MTRIDGKVVFLDEILVTQLSFAVALVDEYTDDRPVGKIRVALQKPSLEGLLNPSGYFLFLNLTDGNYTLWVEAEHYFEEEFQHTIPISPPGNHLVEIYLRPLPSYPFPPGATLIRGLVQDAARKPLVGTKVEMVGKNIISQTAENGEFVLFFKNLKENDIITENSKRFVKGNGNKTITLKLEHPITHLIKTIDISEGVEESKTTSVKISI